MPGKCKKESKKKCKKKCSSSSSSSSCRKPCKPCPPVDPCVGVCHRVVFANVTIPAGVTSNILIPALPEVSVIPLGTLASSFILNVGTCSGQVKTIVNSSGFIQTVTINGISYTLAEDTSISAFWNGLIWTVLGTTVNV